MLIAAALIELNRGMQAVYTDGPAEAANHLRSAKRLLINAARKPGVTMADYARMFLVWLRMDELADAIRQAREMPDKVSAKGQPCTS